MTALVELRQGVLAAQRRAAAIGDALALVSAEGLTRLYNSMVRTPMQVGYRAPEVTEWAEVTSPYP